MVGGGSVSFSYEGWCIFIYNKVYLRLGIRGGPLCWDELGLFMGRGMVVRWCWCEFCMVNRHLWYGIMYP